MPRRGLSALAKPTRKTCNISGDWGTIINRSGGEFGQYFLGGRE